MTHYFTGSYIVTILGIISAYLWGEHVHGGSGFTCIFIALILALLEVSLSFDNAVVNAMKLEKMTQKWRHRFITWGILIAVFGMRFLFPLVVVSIFAHLHILEVLNMAFNDVNNYAHYLELSHAPIVTFGGAFLLMLFLDYFTNKEKEVFWIHSLEKGLQKLNRVKFIDIILTFLCLSFLMLKIPTSNQQTVFLSGLMGIVIFILINSISNWLETKQNNSRHILKYSGLISFLYLELIDASFSLDGVLGAFALSSDILIITIGLFIGAMFVRSLTIMLVEKKTLSEYLYLENGAHWAIGSLAILMFISTFYNIPEAVTGTIGALFIISAFISSLIHNKKVKNGTKK